jgi:predicted dehydrogenase
MKIAVIGCGTIANAAHIPAYQKNKDAEIKYFCDIIPERADEAVKKYGVGKAVYDYREILKDPEVVAVSVCTPNNVHREISIASLKAGKHVLCEKPAARTLSEALEMQKAQHETGKILNIGVVNRFKSSVNAIKQRVDAGELGNLYHVYISFRSHRAIPGLGGAFTTKAIAGGGVLIDWGVHFLDLVMYICGDPTPLSVSGKTFSVLGKDMRNYVYEDMWAGPPNFNGVYDVDDFVTGFIRTSGPSITLNGAWAQNIGHDEMFIDFLGDKAGVRMDYFSGFDIYSTANGKLTEKTPEIPETNMFDEEINAFIDCVQKGEKISSHIDTAIITAKIMQAIYDSSEQNKEVTI